MKKIVTLLLTAALLGSSAAFASDTETISYKGRVFNKADLPAETLAWLEEFNALSQEEQDAIDYAPAALLARGGAEGEVEEISAEESTQEESAVFAEKESLYVKASAAEAKVREVRDGIIEVDAVKADGEEVIFMISEDTLVIDAEGNKTEVKDGDQVCAFTRWNTPMVLSLPVRYNANVIVVNGETADRTVSVDGFSTYEDGYINTAQNLVIRTDNSEIVDREGKKFEGELDGKDLVVVYSITTRSIPAQTNPEKIIVLGDTGALPPTEGEFSPIEEPVTKVAVGDNSFDIEEKNGVDMVKVRAVAEALGLEVGWDNDSQKVTVGTTAMGVNFNIGVNAYNKAKMMPIELESAPVKVETQIGGVTYVPISFFTEVVGCDATTAQGVMTLSIR